MDVQETAAVGSFVWIAGNFRGRNVGVRQRGEIAKRVGDAAGKLSFDGHCHRAKGGNVQRKPYAESRIALNYGTRRSFGLGLALSSTRIRRPE
jgi:hypothetical protein